MNKTFVYTSTKEVILLYIHSARGRFFRRTIAVMCALLALLICAQAAQAAQVIVGMPFSGKWAYNTIVNPPYSDYNSSHPSVHHTPGNGDWATDLYAPANGTPVHLNVTPTSGNVTFGWASSSTSCGQSVRIDVYVDSTYVGWLYIAHLSSATTSGSITNGMQLGVVNDLGCNPGRHIHAEFHNASNYSCYVNKGNPGTYVSEYDPIGVLGSGNNGIRQACTAVPGIEEPAATRSLSFIRLNHTSGNVEVVDYTQQSNYQIQAGYYLTAYPAVTPDGSVVPLYKPNGDLSFVRLNHSSGNVEVVTYSARSNYQTIAASNLAAYPAVRPDGSVIPRFTPNGDLSFIKLNHYSGRVEVVTYAASTGYQAQASVLTAYPAVTPDGSVVPLYKPNGDLSFVRLNHSSGNVEVVTYSASSAYQSIAAANITAAPAVRPDGSVIPRFTPNGDLSLIRLDHSSGHAEVVNYSASSGYQIQAGYYLTAYPAVTPDGSVVPLYK